MWPNYNLGRLYLKKKAKIYYPLIIVFIIVLLIFSLIVIISTRLGLDLSYYSHYLEIIVIILVFSEMILLVNSEQKLLQNTNIVNLSVDTITKSVNLIHRDQIYNSLTETAHNAKLYVKHISIAQSTMENDDINEKERVEKFLNALQYSAEKNKVDIKVLGPEEPLAIGGLYERKNRGCTVRVNEAVNTFDTRIQVVDDKRIIIGLGQPLSQNLTNFKPPKSESGFMVKSYILAEILNFEFDKLWKEEKSKELDTYMKEVLCSKIFVKPIIYSDSFMRDMNNRLNIRNIPEFMDNLERQKCILALKNNNLRENKSYKICCCENIKKIFEDSSDSEIDDIEHIKSKFPYIVLGNKEATMISKYLQE